MPSVLIYTDRRAAEDCAPIAVVDKLQDMKVIHGQYFTFTRVEPVGWIDNNWTDLDSIILEPGDIMVVW